ncbi:DUF5819 family protein [Streptomyces sp. NPDC005526]|uniref:DUF5819 family protein n=1 Tax=Streptomyces sp. NPDC005526 TaxID=3156885 RepID=UPI0033B44C33
MDGRRRKKFGLSLVSRTIIAFTVAGVVVAAAVHLGMVFLIAAPSNTVSQQHAAAISNYLSPEFEEQRWGRLFAPEPPLSNINIQERANIHMPDGRSLITDWADLTATDDTRINHNPLPSHTQQNELPLAWFYFVNSHDDLGHPIGLRGDLMQQYLLRIVAHRIGPHINGGTVQNIQVRAAYTPVQTAHWSSDKIDTTTSYQVEPWWTVSAEDFK